VELGSIASTAAALPQAMAAEPREAAETVRDNESAEATKAYSKAPLPSYAGSLVDVQA
jgi:hypothetical protein